MKRRLRMFVLRGNRIIASLVLVVALVSFNPNNVSAANFEMQTGSYVGTGVAGLEVSGLGFQPDYVMIKSATTAGAAVFKTSAMPANTISFLSATAANTATNITLTSDGFSVGTLANVNTSGVLYFWTAVGGSDCSATGNFCVGTYTGTGGTRSIAVGFQPDTVIVKRSTNIAGHFRTASMPANRTEYFVSTAADTTGAFIASFGATNFNVGASDNTSAAIYYYVAFGGVNSAEGTYTGNGADNRDISGIGIDPNFLVVKNASSATANNRRAYFSVTDNFGDHAQGTGDTLASAANIIQALQTGGFQLGTSVNANESGATFYWFGIGGASGPAASGTFAMKQGVYTGTGATLSISDLGFAPDVVIIKHTGTNFAVFKTRIVPGGLTFYLASTTAAFTGGISTLDSDGFTLGTSTVVNASGGTYHWQAFGNAYNPMTNSGAADFAIGAFVGNAIDNRDISKLPFEPDFVVNSPNTTVVAAYRTSLHGVNSSLFTATADGANIIQALNPDGFQVGTATNVNGAGVIQYWFAFAAGSNFRVGSYTGDAVDARLIPTVSFRPDLVWVKRSTAVAPVMKPETLAGDATLGFLNVATTTNKIEALNGGGFTVGNSTDANAATGAYIYTAWREAPAGSISTSIVDGSGNPIASPARALDPVLYSFSCTESSGFLTTSVQRIRVTNPTGAAGWTTSIAPTAGATALWQNGGATLFFDFNDTSGSPTGCVDGGDPDTVAGQLRVNALDADIAPEPVCSLAGVAAGSTQVFSQGTVNSITLATGSVGADTECYWDIINLKLDQTIPLEQPTDEYILNLTVTTTAS